MTDGFLSGECKHKRVRDLREHSKPKLKWQESIQAFLSYVGQASLLLLMVSPTTKALLLLLALSSCFYLCSLAIAHNLLVSTHVLLSLLALLHLLALSWCYSHFSSYGSWSPPPTCVILISPIKYPLYYLVFFPFIALNVLSLCCSMLFYSLTLLSCFAIMSPPLAYA